LPEPPDPADQFEDELLTEEELMLLLPHIESTPETGIARCRVIFDDLKYLFKKLI
jgi:hypothetical protein